MKQRINKTKSKIVSAAWKLFYEQGFENTTVDEIVELSGTSKGSFYHYFESKDNLVGSLAYLFDEKYTELERVIEHRSSSLDTMMFLTKELCMMIENNIDKDLLSRLYAQQLTKKGERELLDQNREYYRLLKKVIQKGRDSGEITRDKSTAEIAHLYAIAERALIYDWCLHDGAYSLTEYAQTVMPLFLSGLKREKNDRRAFLSQY